MSFQRIVWHVETRWLPRQFITCWFITIIWMPCQHVVIDLMPSIAIETGWLRGWHQMSTCHDISKARLTSPPLSQPTTCATVMTIWKQGSKCRFPRRPPMLKCCGCAKVTLVGHGAKSDPQNMSEWLKKWGFYSCRMPTHSATCVVTLVMSTRRMPPPYIFCHKSELLASELLSCDLNDDCIGKRTNHLWAQVFNGWW